MTKLRFRLYHLLADGAERNAKLCRCGLQRAQTRDSLQCPKTIQMDKIQITHIENL
ncbi:hypothetical protein D3C86_1841400 [compost metagenome]